MEIKAKRGDLLATLYWAQSIVERRNTMPILANALLDAQKGKIQLAATDLEVGVRGQVEGEVAKPGTVTVNAKKLYEIIREIPTEQVQLKRLENDWVEIRSGKSVFKMMGLDAKEFPQFPTFDAKSQVSVSADVLRGMIERTIFAVSTDETRYSLNGVFLEEGGGKVRMVSTDGHRLAFEEQSLGALGLRKGVILPRKGLGELRKLLESGEDEDLLSIGFKENMALASRAKVDLFMRLIDGDFPDYKKVIPQGNPSRARMDHQELLQALRRVSILSSERYKGVKMEFSENGVSISANNPDLGEAVEEMDAEYEGAPISIGFNARYLLDVLGVLGGDGDVSLELKDELSPSIIRKGSNAGYLYVLMPMRL